jgi:hypothetical protein
MGNNLSFHAVRFAAYELVVGSGKMPLCANQASGRL